MSRDEQRLASFLLEQRTDHIGRTDVSGGLSYNMDYCMDLMCCTTCKDPITKHNVCELLKYVGNTDMLDTFQAWEMPKFPFSGHHLVKMEVSRGPKFAKMLSLIRSRWQESRYTASEEDLSDYAKSILHQFVKK